MRTTILATVSILTLGMGGAAFAGLTDDAAYDKGNNPVGDSRGNCVRTKWQGDTDPCSVAIPAPKPAVVVPKPVAVKAAPLPVVSKEASTVYFDFDKTNLDAGDKAKLDKLAVIINQSSAIKDVVIHGYTDQLGTSSYNDALATKRVATVKTYLDGKTKTPTTGDIKGLGKATPIAECVSIKKRTEKIACMAESRRVEIEFKAETPGQ